MYYRANVISVRPQKYLVNSGLLAYFPAVYYFINPKITLKVSVYEYFIKFGEKTEKQPFKSSRS